MTCRCSQRPPADVSGLIDDFRAGGADAVREMAARLDALARFAVRVRDGWLEVAANPQATPALRATAAAAAQVADETRRGSASMKNWVYDAGYYLGFDVGGLPAVPVVGAVSLGALAAWIVHRWAELEELQAQLDHERALLAGAAGATDDASRQAYLDAAEASRAGRQSSGWIPYAIGAALVAGAVWWMRGGPS